MGCLPSKPLSAESVQSKNIDTYLNDSKNDAMLDFKVLLLGKEVYVCMYNTIQVLENPENLLSLSN